MRVFIICVCLFANFYSFGIPNKKNIQDKRVLNLVAFTRAYGYIRYFHPIDKSNTINWDYFLLSNLCKVINCENNKDLKDSLIRLFKPITPLVNFTLRKPNNKSKKLKNTDTIIFHQYRGVNTSQYSYLLFKNYQVQIHNNDFVDTSLFNLFPNYREKLCKQIIPGLYINFSLALNKLQQKSFDENLYERDRSIYYNGITENQIKALIDVMVFWNIIQHFYPYHAESNMNWERALETTIRLVLTDASTTSSEKYIFMLGKEMKDGHFRVMNNLKKGFYLPVHLRVLNSIPVVIESYDTSVFKQGDVLLSINRRTVTSLIDSVKSHWSGSDDFVAFWSGNMMHQSEQSDYVPVELLRGNDTISLWVRRKYYKHQQKSKFLDKRIYYCNLADDDCNMDTIINIASKTDAIILDWRNGSDNLYVHKLFQHMIDDTLTPPLKFIIPQIIYPDHVFDTYYEPKQQLPPLKPKIKTYVVILSGPSNISYEESMIKTAKINSLATIFGETTGGANGSINYSTLPSGLVVGWTGMKVTNLDGSQFHIKGIKPDILVSPTLDGIKTGRDEVLDKAIIFLKTQRNE